MSTKLQPPQLRDESAEGFDKFLLQFGRYLRIAEAAESMKLDLLLFSVGEKAAGFYDELDWPKLTVEEEEKGLTEYLRATYFLREKFMGDKNILSERVRLFHSRQLPSQSINDFVSHIRTIARYCAFPAAFADEALRDAFVQGVREDVRKYVCREFSSFFKAGKTFALSDAIAAAEIEEDVAAACKPVISVESTELEPLRVASIKNRNCFRCGGPTVHGKEDCPAFGKKCFNCNRYGHFSQVCQQRKSVSKSSAIIATVRGTSTLRKYINIKIKNTLQSFLVDSGSELSLLSRLTAAKLDLYPKRKGKKMAQAVDGTPLKLNGYVDVTMEVGESKLMTRLYVAEDLCEEAVLGMDCLKQFSALHIELRGSLPCLKIAALAIEQNLCLQISPQALFNLPAGTVPIKSPTRYRTPEDKLFIQTEIAKLLKDGVIVKSKSPWRSQVVVAKCSSGTKRLVIDYASTVNRFTELDGYPIPLLADVLQQVHGSHVFSKLDMRSAYHQVPIRYKDQAITAFEADSQLWQFTRLPFGVTNGVPVFCRVMNEIVSGLSGVVHYFDDIVVCGHTQKEHDVNLRLFMDRAKEVNLTLNPNKCVFSTNRLNFLGHRFEGGEMTPDPDRLAPLIDFPTPKNLRELERFIGLVVYYSKWVQGFSTIAEPLFRAKNERLLPLPNDAVSAMDALKSLIASASLAIPTGNGLLVLETDASIISIGGVLTENGRPICFFSHKLNEVEKRWSAVELEAFAVVRAVEHMRHYLLGHHFQLVTDQQGVSFLFNSQPRNKIKNSKISRWRLELSEFS